MPNTDLENFRIMLEGGTPDAVVNGWAPVEEPTDPVGISLRAAYPGCPPTKNKWGVTLAWPEGEPGVMPLTSDDLKALPDISAWEDYVTAPDLEEAYHADWSDALAQCEDIRSRGKLAMAHMSTGIFEQMHHLMGFEDALMSFYIDPDATKGLIDLICNWKLRYIEILVEKLHPDAILFHDDWGSKQTLFMSPEIWREFLKPAYTKIYGLMNENNIIGIHHSDSFLEPIVQDIVDVGIKCWQGVLPQNDIPKLQAQTQGKLIYMGGIDAAIVDTADWTEEVVRKEVDRAWDAYVPGGSYIPMLTYGKPGPGIFKGVVETITDEVAKLNEKYYG